MFLAQVPPSFLSREDAGAGILRPGRRGQHLSQRTCCPSMAQVWLRSGLGLAQVSEVRNISFQRKYFDMKMFG